MNPMGSGASRLGHAGRTCGEAGWAAPWIQPKCRFLNKKFFSFSNLFLNLFFKFEFQRILLAQ
jgi:hypothetical protein